MFSSKPVKNKSGKIKIDKDGHTQRRFVINFNWKSITGMLGVIYLLTNIGIFYAQTSDTTKTVIILKSKIDTLQNKVIVEQLANSQKIDHLVTLLDPENGLAKIEKIDRDKKKLLKELESKNREKGNGN